MKSMALDEAYSVTANPHLVAIACIFFRSKLKKFASEAESGCEPQGSPTVAYIPKILQPSKIIPQSGK